VIGGILIDENESKSLKISTRFSLVRVIQLVESKTCLIHHTAENLVEVGLNIMDPKFKPWMFLVHLVVAAIIG
jgi:hypothetical protein